MAYVVMARIHMARILMACIVMALLPSVVDEAAQRHKPDRANEPTSHLLDDVEGAIVLLAALPFQFVPRSAPFCVSIYRRRPTVSAENQC